MTGGWGRLRHLLVCRPPVPLVVAVLLATAVAAEAADSPVAIAAWVVGMGSYVLWSLRSGQRPCPWCAAAMPLNPAQVAERRRRMLWLHHQVVPSIWRTVAVVVGPFLALVVLRVLGVPGTASWLALALALTPLAVAAQAVTVHQRLQPWCPWCRGGGGGEPAVDPRPDPVIRQPA